METVVYKVVAFKALRMDKINNLKLDIALAHLLFFLISRGGDYILFKAKKILTEVPSQKMMSTV